MHLFGIESDAEVVVVFDIVLELDVMDVKNIVLVGAVLFHQRVSLRLVLNILILSDHDCRDKSLRLLKVHISVEFDLSFNRDLLFLRYIQRDISCIFHRCRCHNPF